MTKQLTIALYDQKLFKKLEAMDIGDISFHHLLDPARECEADILLLNDAELYRAAGNCKSASRPSLFVTVDANDPLPSSYVDGVADDLLALPVRRVDIVRLVRLHHQLQSLRELDNSAQTIPIIVEKIQEDLRVAQKVQRRLIKEKFPPISGLRIKSKYWCGLKSGGDYFDVIEFPDGNHVGFLLADCSSYSLSANFLSSLMQLSFNSNTEAKLDPLGFVKEIYRRICGEMNERDEFSILYGVLDRQSFLFKMVSCGKIFALHQAGRESQTWIAGGDSVPLCKDRAEFPNPREVLLEPMDRLLLLSDGWSDGLREPLQGITERLSFANHDAQDLMNEFAFSLRQGAERSEGAAANADESLPMPPQDCSILVVEMTKMLRLASA